MFFRRYGLSCPVKSASIRIKYRVPNVTFFVSISHFIADSLVSLIRAFSDTNPGQSTNRVKSQAVRFDGTIQFVHHSNCGTLFAGQQMPCQSARACTVHTCTVYVKRAIRIPCHSTVYDSYTASVTMPVCSRCTVTDSSLPTSVQGGILSRGLSEFPLCSK